MVKDVLGFNFDGNPREHNIWLTKQRRGFFLGVHNKWIREGKDSAKGISADEFRRYTSKLRNDFLSITVGKGLLSLCNQLLGKEPQKV